MPIYEFYCGGCNTIFSFFSKTVNTSKEPGCPKCKKRKLKREISMFAAIDSGGKGSDGDDLPFDESKMESAMGAMASEAGNIDENDPRQAARLMRKFSNMTGVEFSGGMEEALRRLEGGENPEQIESELGNLMEGEEEPFVLPGKKRSGNRKAPPARDQKLYEM